MCAAALLVVGIGIAGCAPEPTPTPIPTPTPTPDPIEFTIQTSFDAANPAHIFGAQICDNITKMSGGRLVFTPYTGGSIMPATKEMDPVDQGVIDGTYTCTMYNLDK